MFINMKINPKHFREYHISKHKYQELQLNVWFLQQFNTHISWKLHFYLFYDGHILFCLTEACVFWQQYFCPDFFSHYEVRTGHCIAVYVDRLPAWAVRWFWWILDTSWRWKLAGKHVNWVTDVRGGMQAALQYRRYQENTTNCHWSSITYISDMNYWDSPSRHAIRPPLLCWAMDVTGGCVT